MSQNERCDGCAYWTHAEAVDGHCRLLAPHPITEPNVPAHWGRTKRDDFCGDFCGRENLEARRFVACAHCRYWVHVPGGITPTDLADQLPVWWTRAGHCMRHPFRSATISGAKVHWLVTHQGDGCSEGAVKCAT